MSAVCPNCRASVAADAPECPKCHADFGPGSSWKPLRPGEKLVRAGAWSGADLVSFAAIGSAVLAWVVVLLPAAQRSVQTTGRLDMLRFYLAREFSLFGWLLAAAGIVLAGAALKSSGLKGVCRAAIVVGAAFFLKSRI